MAVALENLRTVHEAAEILGLKPSDVYNLVYQRKLASEKIGNARMLDLSDIEAYARKRAEIQQKEEVTPA